MRKENTNLGDDFGECGGEANRPEGIVEDV